MRLLLKRLRTSLSGEYTLFYALLLLLLPFWVLTAAICLAVIAMCLAHCLQQQVARFYLCKRECEVLLVFEWQVNTLAT